MSDLRAKLGDALAVVVLVAVMVIVVLLLILIFSKTPGHEVDEILYGVAVASFVMALGGWVGKLNWIALGLLAWVLVPALSTWGVA